MSPIFSDWNRDRRRCGPHYEDACAGRRGEVDIHDLNAATHEREQTGVSLEQSRTSARPPFGNHDAATGRERKHGRVVELVLGIVDDDISDSAQALHRFAPEEEVQVAPGMRQKHLFHRRTGAPRRSRTVEPSPVRFYDPPLERASAPPAAKTASRMAVACSGNASSGGGRTSGVHR